VAQNVALTQQVFMVIEQELQLTGFWESIPASNKLQSEIQKILLSPDFIKLPNIVQNRKRIISRIMELAKKNNDTILYAD
jgi:type I restriction enzyme, R subunit